MKVIMQSPAAYTLPVKLLTSTNDFLMTGPYVPQNCLFANNHTQTRAARRMRSLPRIHNEFLSWEVLVVSWMAANVVFTLVSVFQAKTECHLYMDTWMQLNLCFILTL